MKKQIQQNRTLSQTLLRKLITTSPTIDVLSRKDYNEVYQMQTIILFLTYIYIYIRKSIQEYRKVRQQA
jgi:hypothetical protein